LCKKATFILQVLTAFNRKRRTFAPDPLTFLLIPLFLYEKQFKHSMNLIG